jgi:dTMP kinase
VKTGRLIVFEGADEVGKTTLASMLSESLAANGVACELVGFPGSEKGSLGRHIYELHHDPGRFQVASINPVSVQMLHVAAHVDAIDRLIFPALRRNKIVVLDRFWWSTWIYGTVTKANSESLQTSIQAEAVHWRGIRPERVFLVTRKVPLEAQPDLARWKRVRALYKKFASEEARKYPVTIIPNDSTPEIAFAEIRRYIKCL